MDNVTRCNASTCVDAVVTADGSGVLVTSTIPGNDGRVTFTRDEWDAFLVQVKEGSWDHTAVITDLSSADRARLAGNGGSPIREAVAAV